MRSRAAARSAGRSRAVQADLCVCGAVCCDVYRVRRTPALQRVACTTSFRIRYSELITILTCADLSLKYALYGITGYTALLIYYR